MKKVLSLMLALLMLFSCGCGVAETEEEDAYAAEIQDNADLIGLAAKKTDSKEIRLIPAEKAFVRGGNYADMNWREINATLGRDTNTAEPFRLKEDGSASYTRRVYFTFDLSSIESFNYKKVFFNPSFSSEQK